MGPETAPIPENRGLKTVMQICSIQLISFITASFVTSIRPLRYILFGRDDIFHMHFNSLVMSVRK